MECVVLKASIYRRADGRPTDTIVGFSVDVINRIFGKGGRSLPLDPAAMEAMRVDETEPTVRHRATK